MTEVTCPRCGAPIPVDPRYVAWCERCEWNLQPFQPARPRGPLDAMYADLGARLGRSMFEHLVRAPSLKPTITPAIFLAVVCAASIHLITLLSFLFGVLLIVQHWFNLFATIGGLLLIWLAWLLRPRLPRFPKRPLPRAQFPGLYGIADAVAQALKAPRVAAIVITPEFNASYSCAGWRRRHVLRLGLPLLSMLDEQETVALIGHELAHAVNDDAATGLFVGSAVNTLCRWHDLVYPDRMMLRTQYRRGIGAVFANLLLVCIAAVIRLVIWGLSHLLWRDKQRAEYLADHLAARVAGTEATLRTLDKMHLGQTVDSAAQRLATGDGSGDFFAELRAQYGAMPEHEWKRLRAVARLEASRLDATHPPTAFRVGLLEARPVSHLMAETGSGPVLVMGNPGR